MVLTAKRTASKPSVQSRVHSNGVNRCRFTAKPDDPLGDVWMCGQTVNNGPLDVHPSMMKSICLSGQYGTSKH